MRVNIPEADAILGKKFKVLDKGYVALIDYCGGDKAIEDFARVSYGEGTRKSSDTRGLIRYLVSHAHTSPLECTELSFSVSMPIHVDRQFARHRTWSKNEYCISGDTEVYFDMPNGVIYKQKISELYRKFHIGAKPIKSPSLKWDTSLVDTSKNYTPVELSKIINSKNKNYSNNIRHLCNIGRLEHTKVDNRISISGESIVKCYNESQNKYQIINTKHRILDMSIRHYDDKLDCMSLSKIVDIFDTGKKPVYLIKTKCGKSIKCTKEHKFLDNKKNFRPLEDIIRLKTGEDNSVITYLPCEIFVNGVPVYQSYDWMKKAKEESLKDGSGILGICSRGDGLNYNTVRKWLKKLKLSFSTEERGKCNTVWNKGITGYKLRPWTEEEKRVMSDRTPKGKNHHAWRGGCRNERNWIGYYINQNRKTICNKYGNKCAKCGDTSSRLCLHHIEEVTRSPHKAYDTENILPVCHKCHMIEHDKLRKIPYDTIYDLDKFDWKSIRPKEIQDKIDVGEEPKKFSQYRPLLKNKKKNCKTTPHLSDIISVSYVGIEDTYDLEIASDSHNYVANGIIVHNSGRYSVIPDVTYSGYKFDTQSTDNKQGRGQEKIDDIQGVLYENQIDKLRNDSFSVYNHMLSNGVAREIARMHLPLNTYTYFHCKVDLSNLFKFLTLRYHPHAQKEIREYAKVMAGMVKAVAPLAFEAWYDYEYASVKFSRLDRIMFEYVQDTYADSGISASDWNLYYSEDAGTKHVELGMSSRELKEFWSKLDMFTDVDFSLPLEM